MSQIADRRLKLLGGLYWYWIYNICNGISENNHWKMKKKRFSIYFNITKIYYQKLFKFCLTFFATFLSNTGLSCSNWVHLPTIHVHTYVCIYFRRQTRIFASIFKLKQVKGVTSRSFKFMRIFSRRRYNLQRYRGVEVTKSKENSTLVSFYQDTV